MEELRVRFSEIGGGTMEEPPPPHAATRNVESKRADRLRVLRARTLLVEVDKALERPPNMDLKDASQKQRRPLANHGIVLIFHRLERKRV
jgi:hypothetical protein